MKKILKRIIPRSWIHALWHKPKAIAAALLYGFPGRKLTVLAVAGTKGKTSTAYFTSQLLDAAGISNVLFSTAAVRVAGAEHLNTLKLTTPTPFYLNKLLATAVKKGCRAAVLEVSSHALVQHRLWGIPIPYVVITNLAPDHLEFHASAEEYQREHLRLITKDLRRLIVNGIDSHSAAFRSLPVETTVLRDTDEEYTELARSVPLKGVFNKVNAYFATTAARTLGADEAALRKKLPELRGAPGRMESIANSRGFDIIVDYAHSLESLEQFFSAVREDSRGRIIAVFGACGDRDPKPRPRMGETLDQYAHTIIVTNDDPYTEDPQKIADDLLSGIRSKTKEETLFVILDRKEAIAKALSLAQPSDCVCILGKGAEQWQVFENKKIPWDDRAVVRDELAALDISHAQTQAR